MKKTTKPINPKQKTKKSPKVSKYQHLPLNLTDTLKPHISFWCTNAQHIWLWPKYPLLEAEELSHVKKKKTSKPQDLIVITIEMTKGQKQYKVRFTLMSDCVRATFESRLESQQQKRKTAASSEHFFNLCPPFSLTFLSLSFIKPGHFNSEVSVWLRWHQKCILKPLHD